MQHSTVPRCEALPITQGQQNQVRLSNWNFNTLLVWKVMNLGYKALHFGWCRQTQEPGVPRGISDSSFWPTQLSKSPIKILIKSYLSPIKSSKFHILTYVWDFFYPLHTGPQSVNWQRLAECKALMLLLSLLYIKRTLSGRKLIFPTKYTINKL